MSSSGKRASLSGLLRQRPAPYRAHEAEGDQTNKRFAFSLVDDFSPSRSPRGGRLGRVGRVQRLCVDLPLSAPALLPWRKWMIDLPKLASIRRVAALHV